MNDVDQPAAYQQAEVVSQAAQICYRVINEVEKTIIGKRYVLELVMVSLLSNGHILFEDYPGLAKTLMSNTFAKALGCKFRRVQFTPDLLPSDITGTYVFNQQKFKFEFHPGPILTNILLADEINRAPPKTQAALLEAMQERQVSIEGVTHHLPLPFIVFATQNPIEQEGTYPLPEAQVDRFMMKLGVGYPDEPTELEIMRRRNARATDDVPVKSLTSPEIVLDMQQRIERVYVDDRLLAYMVRIVQLTRQHPMVHVGASPRGTLALYKLSRVVATLNRRDFVKPDDIKHICIPALRHRLILKPEPRIRGVKTDDIIAEILTKVEVPTAAKENTG